MLRNSTISHIHAAFSHNSQYSPCRQCTSTCWLFLFPFNQKRKQLFLPPETPVLWSYLPQKERQGEGNFFLVELDKSGLIYFPSHGKIDASFWRIWLREAKKAGKAFTSPKGSEVTTWDHLEESKLRSPGCANLIRGQPSEIERVWVTWGIRSDLITGKAEKVFQMTSWHLISHTFLFFF